MGRLKSNIYAAWAEADIREMFAQLQKRAYTEQLHTLTYIGEQFVVRAREIRTYHDITGNLRASIGYVILKDGKILKATKVERFDLIADYIVREVQKYRGLVLIGFAGMEYAAAVEAKNYDVITNSVPTRQVLSQLLK